MLVLFFGREGRVSGIFRVGFSFIGVVCSVWTFAVGFFRSGVDFRYWMEAEFIRFFYCRFICFSVFMFLCVCRRSWVLFGAVVGSSFSVLLCLGGGVVSFCVSVFFFDTGSFRFGRLVERVWELRVEF